jgi:hypothetical protein
VTTVLEPAGQGGRGIPPAEEAATRLRSELPPKKLSWFARNPSWPVTVTLIGWPIWWALGVIESQMFFLMAIPMVIRMYRWKAREHRKIKLPPGFGLYIIFMIVILCGIFTIGLQAPQTIQSSVGDRVAAWLARACDYSGSFIFLVYAGNLTEKELPRRRLAWLLALVGLYTVAGGFLGIVDPHFQITSPLTRLLPSNLQSLAVANPGSSQVTSVLGYAEGRVKAPFPYTDMWGNCLLITLPWLAVAWRSYGSRLQRRIVPIIFALTIIPIAYSLSRGLWVGVGVAVVYLGVRYAAQGKMGLLGALCGTLAVVALLFAATPLGALVAQRLDHGKSNDIRASTSRIALEDGLSSPVIGYGDSRRMQGGTQSIATGRTSGCAKCGNSEVGTSGQTQLLLVTSGVVGVLTYGLFFLYGIWRYRHDRSPYGMCGVLILVLSFPFALVYTAIGPPLGFTMLAYAILWKNDKEMREAEKPPDQPAQPAGPALNGRTPRAAITMGPAI